MFRATKPKMELHVVVKHLCLGLAMKSLTGSQHMIEILIHQGQSVNYHMVEEYETELPNVVQEKC